MLYLATTAALGFSSVLVGPATRAPGIVMQEGEVEAPAPKVAATSSAMVSVNGADIAAKPDAQIKGGSVLSQIAAEGIQRLNNDEANPNYLNSWATSTEPKTRADMIALAIKQNPTVQFWDPLDIISEDVKPETIGWFRHAEIKHGRVAMAAFVGYCFQSNGVVFPWNIQAPIPSAFGGTDNLPAVSFADIAAAGSPADQWDALPTAAKVQIICVVGFLEMWGETSVALEMDGQKHYVRGGKPGYYPRFNAGKGAPDRFPHPVPLNLWDPFGFNAKMSEEKKEKGLIAEVNNGRLAMIGIFGLISASKGLQVPGLDTLGIAQYKGEYMAPFTAADNLPFVDYMATKIGTLGYPL